MPHLVPPALRLRTPKRYRYPRLTTHDIELIKSSISDHLNSLKNNFLKYFLPDVDTSRFDWVQNPFAASGDTVQHLPVKAQEEFRDLSTDTQLKLKFQKQPLSSFWLDIKSEFPFLSNLAIGILLPFASTYACVKPRFQL